MNTEQIINVGTVCWYVGRKFKKKKLHYLFLFVVFLSCSHGSCCTMLAGDQLSQKDSHLWWSVYAGRSLFRKILFRFSAVWIGHDL